MLTLEKISSLGSLAAMAPSIRPMKLLLGICRALIASGLVFLMCSSLVSSETNCQPMSSGLSEKKRLMYAALSLLMREILNDSTTWLIAATSSGLGCERVGVVRHPTCARQRASNSAWLLVTQYS